MDFFINPEQEPVFLSLEEHPIDERIFETQEATQERCAVLAQWCFKYGFAEEVCLRAALSAENIDQAHRVVAAISFRHRVYLYNGCRHGYRSAVWYDADPVLVAVAQHFRKEVADRKERDRIYASSEFLSEALKKEKKVLLEEMEVLKGVVREAVAAGFVSQRPQAQQLMQKYTLEPVDVRRAVEEEKEELRRKQAEVDFQKWLCTVITDPDDRREFELELSHCHERYEVGRHMRKYCNRHLLDPDECCEQATADKIWPMVEFSPKHKCNAKSLRDAISEVIRGVK